MADEVSSHTSKPQKQAHEAPSHDPSNPPKASPHYLYKATLVTAFLVLLPFFPSLAPDFINQTLHARSWELLQLIFVGIAVSYGLFSKKNDEAEKDHGSKLDNAQSYVSKLLQVSSVFDDESSDVIEENKIQTLMNSKYYRGEPLVLVANRESSVSKEESVASEIRQKPLLLPVRSLKNRVSDVDLVDDSGGGNGLMNRSGSQRFTGNSRKPNNTEIGGLNFQKMEEKLEENMVLRSPIPWRSRSGRMQMREIGDEEPELNRADSNSSSSSKNFSLSSSSSSFSSVSSPKKKLSPSTSFSPAPPPPPPPPPPPTTLRKSVLMKSNSSVVNNAVSPEKKVLRRSARSVPAEEMELRGSRIQNDGLLKSVRTFRPSSDHLEAKGYIDKMINVKVSNEATQTDYYVKKQGNNQFVSVDTSSDEEVEESEVETEDDYFEGSLGSNNKIGEGANHDDHSGGVNDVGPDVDKKADEFIAKFREQIRLQRIESIRKSTAQRTGNTFR